MIMIYPLNACYLYKGFVPLKKLKNCECHVKVETRSKAMEWLYIFDRLDDPSEKDCCIKTHCNISFLKDTDKTE